MNKHQSNHRAFMNAEAYRPKTFELKLNLPARSYQETKATIDACKGVLKKLKSDYRARLNQTLADLYHLSLKLKNSPGSWQRFCEEEQWGEKPPLQSDRENALKHVLRWACDPSRTAQKDANFYLRALKNAIKLGATPGTMSDVIKRAGGLKKLSASTNRKKEKPKGETAAQPMETEEAITEAKQVGEPPPINEKLPVTGSWVAQHRHRPTKQSKREAYRGIGTTTLSVSFNNYLKEWVTMKQGSRFTITAVLDDMTGSAGRITVEGLTLL